MRRFFVAFVALGCFSGLFLSCDVFEELKNKGGLIVVSTISKSATVVYSFRVTYDDAADPSASVFTGLVRGTIPAKVNVGFNGTYIIYYRAYGEPVSKEEHASIHVSGQNITAFVIDDGAGQSGGGNPMYSPAWAAPVGATPTGAAKNKVSALKR